MTNAFLTGSQVFGYAESESDVDLCVLINKPDAELLSVLSVQAGEY